MLEDEEQKFVETMKDTIATIKEEMDKIASTGSREISLAKTKLDEAVMWTKEHFKL